MNLSYFYPVKVMVGVLVFLIVGCSDASSSTKSETQQQQEEVKAIVEMTVYKSSSCTCCQKWVEHIEESGFDPEVNNISLMSQLKDEKGIATNYRSCHTAVSKDGYVFEGHVPAKFIQQFMKETHADDVIGLAAPGMGMGSPGMEMGDKFTPYQVLLLKNDGSSEVYVAINSSKEQY